MPEVVGLGLSCIDYTGVVERIPGVDETTMMLDFTKQMGGPVAVALATFAHLGGAAGYIGKVGKDEEGRLIKRTFYEFGVDTTCLMEDEAAKTPLSFILVEKESGKRTIIFNPGCAFDLTFEECDPAYIGRARFLHLDGGSTEAAIGAATWAREKGIKVVLDAGMNLPWMADLVRRADIVIASEGFTRDFTQENDLVEGGRKMIRLGPGTVVVTCGSHGSICMTEQDTFHQPAFKVNVVDTTGAGDVFHGAFLYGLARGFDLTRVVEFSSATAALKCTKLGGLRGIPDLGEVNRFLQGTIA